MSHHLQHLAHRHDRVVGGQEGRQHVSAAGRAGEHHVAPPAAASSSACSEALVRLHPHRRRPRHPLDQSGLGDRHQQRAALARSRPARAAAAAAWSRRRSAGRARRSATPARPALSITIAQVGAHRHHQLAGRRAGRRPSPRPEPPGGLDERVQRHHLHPQVADQGRHHQRCRRVAVVQSHPQPGAAMASRSSAPSSSCTYALRGPGRDRRSQPISPVARAGTPDASSSARSPSRGLRGQDAGRLEELQLDDVGVARGDSRTCRPRARSSVFISCRLTAGSATRRSDTMPPDATSPAIIARLIIREAGCASRLADHPRPLGEHRAVRHAQPGRHVGRDVHVHQPVHARRRRRWW